MSAPSSALHSYLLEKLNTADGQKLPGSKFTAPAAVRKRLGIGEPEVKGAVAHLVEHGQVEEIAVGKNRSYRLTPSGKSYLESLQPTAPPLKETLFPYQKAFVLLQFFKAKDGRLTPDALAKKLVTDEIVGYLEFVPMDEAEKPAKTRRPDAALLDWILHTLTTAGALERRDARGTLSYRLTEPGERMLWGMDQYPSIRIQLNLKGERLNEVLRTIRGAGGEKAPAPSSDQAPPAVDGFAGSSEAVISAPSPRPAPLSPPLVLETLRELLRDRFQSTAKVPIYELRAVLAERVGDEAAAHESLDPLLMRLDREDRIRLIAIGDRSRATDLQLDDSIPGENETFFQIEIPDEHQHY